MSDVQLERARSIEQRANDAGGDVEGALHLALDLAQELPLPGQGRTGELWSALRALGRADLVVARGIEPHLDARNILAEAGEPMAPGETWGVFAAEGAGTRVEARRRDGAWVLSGRKPWCSLARRLDRALVTAWTSDTERALFAVDLRDPRVSVPDVPWRARGLRAVESGPVDLDHVPAGPVGAPQWYLDRPGFAWGGIGVAAVWAGGAEHLAQSLRPDPAGRAPDQVAHLLRGRADAALYAAGSALESAAAAVDRGSAGGPAGALLAARVRAVVAQAAEIVLEATAHGLGPGPLVTDEAYAAVTADLHLYLRQWHAERDLAALGALLGPDDER